MNKTIKSLKQDLALAEKQESECRRKAARERQAKFRQTRKAEGKKRISAWLTADEATLVNLVLGMSRQDQQQLANYLQQRNCSRSIGF